MARESSDPFSPKMANAVALLDEQLRRLIDDETIIDAILFGKVPGLPANKEQTYFPKVDLGDWRGLGLDSDLEALRAVRSSATFRIIARAAEKAGYDPTSTYPSVESTPIVQKRQIVGHQEKLILHVRGGFWHAGEEPLPRSS